MKLFRSKIFRYVLLVGIVFFLMYLIIYVQKAAVADDVTQKVYVAKKTIDKKHLIESADLKVIEVTQSTLPSQYITNESQAIGKYIVETVREDMPILLSNLSEEQNAEEQIIPEGYGMISIALNIDEAAGWRINIGQSVDLVYTPIQYNDNAALLNEGVSSAEFYKSRVFKDVVIVDIMNEATISTDNVEFSGVPKYVAIVLKNQDAEFLLHAKDRGQLGIIVKSE